MFFSLRNIPTTQSQESIKFLVLYVSSNISWESHIKYLSGKLYRVIYLIRKLKSYKPDNYLRFDNKLPLELPSLPFNLFKNKLYNITFC